MRALLLPLLLGLVLTSCARAGGHLGGSEPTDGQAVGGGTSETTHPPDRCDFAAIGLGDATPVTYRPPDGCRAQATTTEDIRDEAAFQAAFGCSAPSGVDWGRSPGLQVVMRLLSPATVGIEVVDDGRALTFVSLQRAPESGGYPPMPVTVPVAYLPLPIGGDFPRDTAEAVCTVSSN